ncbi:MAG: hypothetical protein DRG50_04745 [Deltaproteobacteria bacterium]|nr:MAG: hypothetical protein DRG50_04745 [Deltaproteobacteria bacterium]
MMNKRGFTLLELVLVIVVLGLLAGATITLVTELAKHKHYEQTKKDLSDIKEALIGYAGINNRLPWADDPNNPDGVGDPNREVGTLPYVDLGLGGVDSWRNRYWYHVHGKLPGASSLQEFCNVLSVLSGNPPGEYPQLIISGSSPVVQAAVIISRGENSALDEENGDGDGVYETKSPTDSFDDMLAFLNPNYLYSKLDCSSTTCSTFNVYNLTRGSISVLGGSYILCTNIAFGSNFVISSGQSVNVYQGIRCSFYRTSVTFNSAAAADGDGDCNVALNSTFNLVDR